MKASGWLLGFWVLFVLDGSAHRGGRDGQNWISRATAFYHSLL